MKSILIASLLLTFSAFANSNDLAHRPKSFSTPKGMAVFVDFTDAVYNVTYDILQKVATVRAEIKFSVPEAGLPIFDSVQDPTSIILDGVSITATKTKTPNNETTLRVLDKAVTVGNHTMTIEVPLKELVSFGANSVNSAFWTSDLDERQFLELYMPANFEFDQVKMSMNITFIGAKDNQQLYTNGVVAKKANGYSISFPAHYTASSIFFHTVAKGSVVEARATYRSIDGRELPVVVYTKSAWGDDSGVKRLKDKALTILDELEKDYGAFLHPSVTIYNAGSGGMEYCGATMTDSGSMGHELFHSYFARGVMPANGNSGWMDEALASWRDDGYPSSASLFGSSRMSSHPYYTRTTDTAAYSFGARFMSYLDNKFAPKGGLKPFMRMMVEKRSLKPIFVEEFSKAMGDFYSQSVEEDFKK